MEKILVTGTPGVGKTTIARAVADGLRDLRPAGFITGEIREGGRRRGFSLEGLDGRRAVLAHEEFPGPHRVGRYGVDVEAFEGFLGGTDFFSPSSGLTVIDEIGKMECFSERFAALVERLMEGDRPLVATVALRGGGLIGAVKRRQNVRVIVADRKNRDRLPRELAEEVRACLTSR